MPYIKPKIRELYDDTIEHFEAFHAKQTTAGELNYLITSLCHSVLKKQGLCYTNVNTIMGVLECVKAELYRTIASPYEDKKRLKNGTVSDLDNSWREQMR